MLCSQAGDEAQRFFVAIKKTDTLSRIPAIGLTALSIVANKAARGMKCSITNRIVSGGYLTLPATRI